MTVLPLNRALHLLAEEVDGLAPLASRVTRAFAAVLRDAAPTPDLLRDAQALDELEQRIAGLRDYLDGLAHVAPDGVALEVAPALARLTLSAQSDRLSGRDGAVASTGALELF